LKEKITGDMLRNFVKAIKLFCEVSHIPVSWKKISRGLSKTRRYAQTNLKSNYCIAINFEVEKSGSKISRLLHMVTGSLA
jgi:hypothetical protein